MASSSSRVNMLNNKQKHHEISMTSTFKTLSGMEDNAIVFCSSQYRFRTYFGALFILLTQTALAQPQRLIRILQIFFLIFVTRLENIIGEAGFQFQNNDKKKSIDCSTIKTENFPKASLNVFTPD